MEDGALSKSAAASRQCGKSAMRQDGKTARRQDGKTARRQCGNAASRRAWMNPAAALAFVRHASAFRRVDAGARHRAGTGILPFAAHGSDAAVVSMRRRAFPQGTYPR